MANIDHEESNRALIASLRTDPNEEALHKIALDDFENNRMTKPQRVDDEDISQVRSRAMRALNPCVCKSNCVLH